MMRSVGSFFSLVILAIIFSGCGIGDKSTEDYLARAREYQSDGDYKAAIIELKNALRQSPDSSAARMLLGSLYLDTGNADGAEKELQRSASLGVAPHKIAIPLLKAQIIQGKFEEVLDYEIDMQELSEDDQAALLALRGDAQFGLRQLDKAQDLYNAAMALRPDSADARFGSARLAAARGDLSTARAYLEKVLKTREGFAPAWSFLADIEQHEGKMTAAEANYSKALALRPGNVYDLANRALVRISLNKISDATLDVHSAIQENQQLSGKQPLVSYAWGQLKLSGHELEDAANAFDETLKLAPDYLPARYFLAVAQYRLGRFEQAEKTLRVYRYKAPQYEGGHKLFAAIKVAQGQYDVAQSELENILSFDPDDSWALDLLADIAVMQGSPDQSIENYRKIVELKPDSEIARINLALSLMSAGSKEAQEVLTESVATGKSSTQSKLLLVVSYLKARKWDEAIIAAENVVAENEGNWDAYTLLGGAYLGKGNVEKARDMFEQALKLNSGNPNAANNLARLELKAGNEAAARKLYEQTAELYPSEVSAILSLGALDSRHGKYNDAIARTEAALNRNPQDMSLRLALARLYQRTGQPSRNLNLMYEEPNEQANHPLMLQVLGDSQSALGDMEAAAATYEKVVKLVPESATAHYLLARTYAARNQLDRAEQQLQQVIELEPSHFAASVLRIRLLRLARKEQEALQALYQLDPAHANRPEILVERGWLALYQKDFAEATKAFERAFELIPSSDLVIQLGVAKWNAGDQAGTLDDYKAWLQANPTDAQVLFHLANSHLQLGHNEEAVAAFRKVLEQKPDDPIILNNLAWLLRDTDPKTALQFAERTTSITPDWASGIDTLGMIYLGQGDTTQAYRYFEQALKKSPESPEIRYHLALASSRMGDREQARQILKAMLAEREAEFGSRKDAEELFLSLKE